MDTTLFPYDTISDSQMWQKSVASVANEQINPHAGMTAKFRFDKNTKMASAGSCFAQRLSESLQAFGFHYLITEPGPAWLPANLRQQYQYGTYTARFGNIYSALQMRQLLQRAYGEFQPIDQAWQTQTGWVDPFRPRIQPKGFASLKELQADQASHFAAVRQMFETAEVFVFTMGLTEIWQDNRDDAVYPICPGRQFGRFEPALYRFHNLSVNENIQHMTAWIGQLQQMNPQLKILLTVSPVPLAATMEPKHVLQATIYSKSVLRVVAEELRQRYDHVDYFASYEIITATYNQWAYYHPDKRNVTDAGVEHVIRVFFDHFSDIPYQDCQRIDVPEMYFEPQPCDEEELLEYLRKEH